MNTKLVKSLVQTIQSLNLEERRLFEEELFLSTEEVTTAEIVNLSAESKSFDFLHDEPDIYSLKDGEPV